MIKCTKNKHNRRTSNKVEDECNKITSIKKNINNMTIWKNIKIMTTRGNINHNDQDEHKTMRIKKNTRS